MLREFKSGLPLQHTARLDGACGLLCLAWGCFGAIIVVPSYRHPQHPMHTTAGQKRVLRSRSNAPQEAAATVPAKRTRRGRMESPGGAMEHLRASMQSLQCDDDLASPPPKAGSTRRRSLRSAGRASIERSLMETGMS